MLPRLFCSEVGSTVFQAELARSPRPRWSRRAIGWRPGTVVREPGALITRHWGSFAMEELFSEETLAKARTAKIYIEHLYKVQSQNVKERRDR